MPEIAGNPSTLRNAHLRWRQTARPLFTRFARDLTRILRQHAGPDGTIAPRRRAAVVAAFNDASDAFFVGPRGTPLGRNELDPQSPYATALFAAIEAVTLRTVTNQQRWLDRRLPGDVLLWLSNGRDRRVIAEQRRVNFGPDHPLIAKYRDTFVDTELLDYEPFPEGYRLSDRVWGANRRTRARLERYVGAGIRQGEGAARMARRLEQFVIPGRALIRTRTPYGRDASFDAMRLARTEITSAAGRATLAASRTNPYIQQIEWRLSGSHPLTDPCDQTAGLYPKNDVPPYPEHPNCLCVLVPVSGNVREVTRDLREIIEQSEGELAPFLNPAQARELTRQIIEQSLRGIRTGPRGATRAVSINRRAASARRAVPSTTAPATPPEPPEQPLHVAIPQAQRPDPVPYTQSQLDDLAEAERARRIKEPGVRPRTEIDAPTLARRRENFEIDLDRARYLGNEGKFKVPSARFDDGGRWHAGYDGAVGDCTVRAHAIQSNQPYEVAKTQLENLRLADARARGTFYPYYRNVQQNPYDWNRGAVFDDMADGLGYRRAFRREQGGRGIRLDRAFAEYGDGVYRIDRHVFSVRNGIVEDTWDSRWNKGETAPVFVHAVYKFVGGV